MIVKEQAPEYAGKGVAQMAPVRTVKEMDEDEQPREKAFCHGVGVLSIPELLAVILRTGIPGKPITEMMREMMRANDGRLHTLERRSRAEIIGIKGIGRTKAIQIEAVMELIRRYTAETASEDPVIRCSQDIFRVMQPRIGNLPHEEIWVLLLARNNRIIRMFRASQGGLTSSVFDIKVVMKEALVENAASLALCHNHPSGNLTPSRSDDAMTEKCVTACRDLDIAMLDHLIVTAQGYFSYRDAGRMP